MYTISLLILSIITITWVTCTITITKALNSSTTCNPSKHNIMISMLILIATQKLQLFFHLFIIIPLILCCKYFHLI